MSYMVERVARALCIVSSRLDPASLARPVPNLAEDWVQEHTAEFLDCARAAIEAMREPTAEMLAAGNREHAPSAAWRAMIDEALR